MPKAKGTKNQRRSAYAILKTKGAKEFVEDFVGKNPSQTTASTYQPISSKSCDSKDKVYYRRSQKQHSYSDVRNDSSLIYERLSEGVLLREKTFLYNFGLHASFGDQINKKEIFKEPEERSKTNKESSSYKKSLDSRILIHKTSAVKNIVENCNQKEFLTILVDKNQISANYPCVIVRLNDSFAPHEKMKKNDVLNEYYEAYPEFLTHLLIACINKKLYENGIGIYFERRQSFGFLTPTATDVGSAIRLSLGLVPNTEWIGNVCDGIAEFDTLLNSLWEQGCITELTGENTKQMGMPQAKFKSGGITVYGHKIFLMALLEIDEITELPGMDGENGIIKLIKILGENYSLIKKKVESENYFSSLVDALCVDFGVDTGCEFDDLYSEIFLVYARLNQKNYPVDYLNTINSLYEKIKLLVSEIDAYKLLSVEQASKLKSIEVTSESEDELEKTEKCYTPTGMSALSAPLFVYEDVFSEKKYNPTLFKTEKYSYFELASWNKLKLSGARLEKIEDYLKADVIYVDNNPCVSKSEAPISTLDVIEEMNKGNKNRLRPRMLIVDVTSSTQKQIEVIQETWKNSDIPLLCFAASGLKHHQIGLDMAQYGENRIFVNNDYLDRLSKIDGKAAASLKKKCQEFTEEMREITRASSSVYATYVRRAMRDAAFDNS